MLLKYTALPAQPVGLETCRPVESIGRVTIPDPFPQLAPISGRATRRTYVPSHVHAEGNKSGGTQSGCLLP